MPSRRRHGGNKYVTPKILDVGISCKVTHFPQVSPGLVLCDAERSGSHHPG